MAFTESTILALTPVASFQSLGEGAVILLTEGGGEYTAVQSIKAGAFDYVPKSLMSREQIISCVQREIGRAHV